MWHRILIWDPIMLVCWKHVWIIHFCEIVNNYYISKYFSYKTKSHGKLVVYKEGEVTSIPGIVKYEKHLFNYKIKYAFLKSWIRPHIFYLWSFYFRMVDHIAQPWIQSAGKPTGATFRRRLGGLLLLLLLLF